MSIHKIILELTNLYKQKIIDGENPFKIKAYKNAIGNIKHANAYIGVPGVGKGILEKIDMILAGRTFGSKKVDKYNQMLKIFGDKKLNGFIQDIGFEGLIRSDYGKSMLKLSAIPGVGPTYAEVLYRNYGIRNETEYRKRLDLQSNQTKIYFKYKKYIQKQFDRYTVDQIISTLNFPKTVVGSYRRDKVMTKDIDILVRKYPKFDERFIPFSVGSKRASVYYWFNEKLYQIDFLLYDSENKPFMSLYFTGSFQFNIYMRGIAKRNGYKLNQYGLFKNDKKVKYYFKTERDIFKFLGMQYLKPNERNFG